MAPQSQPRSLLKGARSLAVATPAGVIGPAAGAPASALEGARAVVVGRSNPGGQADGPDAPGLPNATVTVPIPSQPKNLGRTHAPSRGVGGGRPDSPLAEVVLSTSEPGPR